MRELFLAKLSKEYQESFKKYVQSYKEVDDKFYFNFYKKALENFNEYLNDLHNYSNGIDLPQGMVTTSTFWLIDNIEVVGVLRIRHQDAGADGNIGYDVSPLHRKKGYGTIILQLALVEAEKIGLKEVIVTCNADNIYSNKIVEKNSGKFLETIYIEEENENVNRYSISTLYNKS